MNDIILFHGTNYINGINILNNGFNILHKIWNQSDNNKIYFWNKDKLNYNECIERTYNSACYSSAISDSKQNKLVVLEFIIDRKYNNLIYDDNSCDLSEASCMNIKDINKLITNKNIKIIPYYFKYNPDIREKYLYIAYHNCGGVKWDSIKDNIVNINELLYKLKQLEKEYNYEYWFKEIEISKNR